MPTLQQVHAFWSGFLGAPGVSTFYFQDVLDDEVPQAAVGDFFDAIKAIFPSDVVITVEKTGTTIDTTTGQPNGSWSGEADQQVIGTGADNYSAPSGAVVTWHTGFFAGGREVRGRTFLVPMTSSLYDGTGDITAEAQVLINDAAEAFIDQGSPSIWGPTSHTAASVTSATVPRRPAVLRSRRD
jgi:hypothetical protein